MFRPSGVRAREAVRGLQALARKRDAIGNPFFSAIMSAQNSCHARKPNDFKGLRFLFARIFIYLIMAVICHILNSWGMRTLAEH